MNDYIVMQELPSGKMQIAQGNGSGTHALQDALTLLASLRFNFPTIQFFVVRVVVVEDVPAVLDPAITCTQPLSHNSVSVGHWHCGRFTPCRKVHAEQVTSGNIVNLEKPPVRGEVDPDMCICTHDITYHTSTTQRRCEACDECKTFTPQAVRR